MPPCCAGCASLGVGETVWAPAFERQLGQPVAGAIAVTPEVRLVITEGDYLLVDRPEWRAVRGQLDEVWFVAVEDLLRRRRLLDRHVRFGKSAEAAAGWVDTVDEPNAVLVAPTRSQADRVVDLTPGLLR